MADALCVPAELLLPATPADVADWRGPVWWAGRLWVCVAHGTTSRCGPTVVLAPGDAPSVLEALLGGLVPANLREVRLPLTRSEVRDWGWRRVVAALGTPVERPVVAFHEDGLSILVGEFDPDGHMYVWDRQGQPAGAARVPVPKLAGLDPLDDTRLPDGSRRVDALALGCVWEVCGG